MVRLTYVVLSYVVFVLGLPLCLLRRRWRPGLARRMGCYPGGGRWPEGGPPRIWFHGASGGDVQSLQPVIRRVRAALPEATLVVSTITDAGHRVAQEELSGIVDGVTFAPFDVSFATRRAVRAIAPDVLVLEYAELWPQLLASAAEAGAARVLVNGRLHPDRMWRYAWLNRLAGATVERLDRLLMRTPADADRARRLGAPAARVEVAGSTEIDDLGCTAADPVPIVPDGRWLVAGSTHVEDEAPVMHAFRAVRDIDPSSRLLIAPCYPQRAQEVSAAARDRGWTTARLEEGVGSADVVVMGELGRLRAAYRSAWIAIVGGSFGRHGGHNILEPAAVGVPVLTGPDLSRQVESVELLRGEGLIQASDATTMAQVAADLWADATLRDRLAARAAQAVGIGNGAAQRAADAIVSQLRTDHPRDVPGGRTVASVGPAHSRR